MSFQLSNESILFGLQTTKRRLEGEIIENQGFIATSEQFIIDQGQAGASPTNRATVLAQARILSLGREIERLRVNIEEVNFQIEQVISNIDNPLSQNTIVDLPVRTETAPITQPLTDIISNILTPSPKIGSKGTDPKIIAGAILAGILLLG